MDDQKTDAVIASEDELRGNYGEPMDIALMKQLGKLDEHCKDFISRSPFLCIGAQRRSPGIRAGIRRQHHIHSG